MPYRNRQWDGFSSQAQVFNPWYIFYIINLYAHFRHHDPKVFIIET